MYQGAADWDEIARVVDALDIPVVGNGDIKTPKTCSQCAVTPDARGS
jgi:tRNA-dihydrouridine synthase